ncbi:MAG: hypothetical protein PHC90_04650 [Syntrophorhabdaceae bacterium]|nr:hypothetical protein [Syntrophorhabdaceae bacterium]
MAGIADIVSQMRLNPNNVRYRDLCLVCDHYFGKARQSSGSHRIYKTPWPGDPRVNIQNEKGRAKVYQVRQALLAIEKLEAEHGSKK